MSKIKTLIFDFGDVFINLDKQGAMENALNIFGLNKFSEDMIKTNLSYEIGQISTDQFIQFYTSKFPHLNVQEITNAWNYIIKDFPLHRLDFIQKLKEEGHYKLILLSNTNDLHIEFVKNTVPFFNEFKSCFDAFYLSQKIHLRKPNIDIFQYAVNDSQIIPQECLFIDDTKENTDTASQMGFYSWNIDKINEDITNLFQIKKELF